jgi:hypothetical protein
MKKVKVAGTCPVCQKEFYTNYRKAVARHMRNHPGYLAAGRKWFPGAAIADYDFELLRNSFRSLTAQERATMEGGLHTTDQVIKLDSDLKDLVQIGNAVNGCWSVTFNQEALQVRDDILVNHPPHYGGGNDPYEAIKVIHAWNLGFDLGNVLKYIRRADLKGTPIQDLEKAKFYLEDEIKRRKEVAATTAATPNAQT